jgi:hypothetical protein
VEIVNILYVMGNALSCKAKKESEKAGHFLKRPFGFGQTAIAIKNKFGAIQKPAALHMRRGSE